MGGAWSLIIIVKAFNQRGLLSRIIKLPVTVNYCVKLLFSLPAKTIPREVVWKPTGLASAWTTPED